MNNKFGKGLNMYIPDIPWDALTICYCNGYKTKLPLKEACEAFHKYNFGWLRTGELAQLNDCDPPRQLCVTQVAKPTGAIFLLKLMTRGSLSIAIGDACMVDEHGEVPTSMVFTQYACRARRVFAGTQEAFELNSDYIRNGKLELAYRMKSDYSWIIIMGIDPASGFNDSEIYWPVFKIPPSELKL